MLADVFKKDKPILGKVALGALPGAPGWEGHWEDLIMRAEQEATALATGGVDGLILENTFDVPYTAGPIDVAGAIALAMLARRIRQFTHLPIGISVLQNDPDTALAVAVNVDAAFIRMPILSGALLTESGVIQGRMNELTHYKNKLKTELPLLLVDVSANHFLPGTGLQSRQQTDTQAHLSALLRHLAEQKIPVAAIIPDDGLSPEELAALKAEAACPLLIENRHNAADALAYFKAADGMILDADIRKNGPEQGGMPPTIDMSRVEELVNILREVVPVTEMDPDVFLKR